MIFSKSPIVIPIENKHRIQDEMDLPANNILLKNSFKVASDLLVSSYKRPLPSYLTVVVSSLLK